jgi:hypothetical protein
MELSGFSGQVAMSYTPVPAGGIEPFHDGATTRWRHGLRIPTKSAVDSERRRPCIPIEAGRGFR